MLTMAALRRLAGLQRLLGLPARAVSSDQTTNSTVSARISRAPRPLEVVEWHPIKEHEETNPFIKYCRDFVVEDWFQEQRIFENISAEDLSCCPCLDFKRQTLCFVLGGGTCLLRAGCRWEGRVSQLTCQ
ncbi:NADH dehydrogenase [ubiquinone] 1 beta subcomplex subunit 11, mitochondrial isoform X2 [Ahaetulla prasina]|uniref:NADH dehydrogenase [ubiquinone] 1 beta subcomplex subunit 11, mitochondrial isoform X2 n=1 Tax=Ahaetulla prasina TaxID=499056 RepID=UPI002647C78C|nr:NADH dehydrogenase [ubiquinone] 1 beta subcomplex subunit 11, mitochondrial isoform X2 [Ahaetulla prasina]